MNGYCKDIVMELNDKPSQSPPFEYLRRTQYDYIDKGGHVYLDYTGAGLASRAQYQAHQNRLLSSLLGNPHSVNPTSTAATKLIEQARSRVLNLFNASPQEYVVIFTQNATGAARLIGESYPFRRRSRLVLTADNHNSINGLRQFARKAGTKTTYIPLETPSLRVDPKTLLKGLPHQKPSIWSGKKRGLFAYPAQSNFTGVQHPLSWIETAQSRGYDVLLDAAAFVPTNQLDLSKVQPEFVTVSWYKMFGYPTGVGCLIARRTALERLNRPWFSGGTVQAATVGRSWELLLRDEAGFEDGTVNFQAIPDVSLGIDWVSAVGLDNIGQHVKGLTAKALRDLNILTHSNGAPMVRLYGPTTVEHRGGTIAFSLCDPSGRPVDDRVIGLEAAEAGISLRTGCFCNPGAGESALGVTRKMIQVLEKSTVQNIDEFLRLLDLESAGVVRISFGIASIEADVDFLCDFLLTRFRDRFVDVTGLGARDGC